MAKDWQDALEVQLELHRWWRSPIGKKFGDGFGKSITASYERAARAQAIEEGRNPDAAVLGKYFFDNLGAAAAIAEHEAQALGRGETYFVERQMAAFAGAAAQSLGDEANLKPEDLPHAHGFIFIEGGIPMFDVNGDLIIVHAISWGTDAFEDPLVRAVDYALYSDLADERETTADARDWQSGANRRMYRYALFHVGALLYGKRKWPNAEEVSIAFSLGQVINPETVTEEQVVKAAHSTVDMEKWLAAFWLLIDEPIVEAVQRRPRRHLGRRAARELGQVPDETGVKLVRLRRLNEIEERYIDYEYDADASAARYSHRWYVTPHWRRLRDGRVTRVRGHIKGPSTAPLIIRDHVYVWER